MSQERQQEGVIRVPKINSKSGIRTRGNLEKRLEVLNAASAHAKLNLGIALALIDSSIRKIASSFRAGYDKQ